MAATAAQPKVEKKIMDEKIAKVREVVKNVSTNDIVLALHNFELDVARTIHAFCEGGSEVALGDWERTSGAAKKRNQKKKSKGSAIANPSLSLQSKSLNNNNSGTTTPSVASSLINCSNVSSATNLADKLLTNGTTTEVPTNAIHQSSFKERRSDDGSAIVLIGGGGDVQIEKPFSAEQQSNQFVHPGEGVFAKAGIDKSSMANRHQRPAVHSTTDHGDHHQRMVGGGVVVGDSFGLVDYQSQLSQNREMLEREVSTAQEAIYHCFKELRDVLAAREQRLMDELMQCRTDGHRYFDARTVTLRALIADSAHPKSSCTASFVTSLEKFNAKKTDDLEVALTARFLCDNSASSIAVAIAQLGKVPTVCCVEPTPLAAAAITHCDQPLTNGDNKSCGEQSSKSAAVPATAPPLPPRTENAVKRSNSPSSLVSSVGEDSGLGGQISPVNHVEKGQPVRVEENGIVLKSDSVSADQLAEIQKQIAESLKAKGIDPAMLASFGTATTVAARRRGPPPRASTKNNNGGGPSLAGEEGGNHRKQQKQQQQHHQPKHTMNNGGEKLSSK